MPTSTFKSIQTYIEIVEYLKPKSILDVGLGFGKWGFITREYTDVRKNRIYKDDWKVKIDGVEIYEPYILPHQRYIYDQIFIEDIAEKAEKMEFYDIVIAADIIEHLEKHDAVKVLSKLAKNSRCLIVSIPIGKKGWEIEESNKGVSEINEAERHKSYWFIRDFKKLGFRYFNIQTSPYSKAKIGLFIKTKHLPALRMSVCRLTELNQLRQRIALFLLLNYYKILKRAKLYY